MSSRQLVTAVVAGLLLVLPACSPSSEGGDRQRGDQMTVREDTPPITRRFSALGQITAVHWLGGTKDGWFAVGPSTYTIKAVLTLAPGTTQQLAALQPTDPPDIPDLLERSSPHPRPGPPPRA